MKKIISTTIAGLLLSSLISVQAEDTTTTPSDTFKKVNIGVGIYALSVSDDNSVYSSDELSGFGLSAMYAFNDSFAVKGTYYSLEHDTFSIIEDTGYDIVGYFGTGLATSGFKAYIGGGLFSESWSAEDFSKKFSGLQLNGGIGYNWEVIALDLVLGIRESDDYQTFTSEQGITIDPTAISTSLIISARF